MSIDKLGTVIDGICSTEDLDSSGERIMVKNIDITSLTKGVVNFEHKAENNLQVIGRIVAAKKILKKSDIENDRHKHFWEKNREKPYLYIACVLFDKLDHDAAKAAASMFKFDSLINKEEVSPVCFFSIEGSRLGKEGSNITSCIARDVALTKRPCNHACTAELMENPDKYLKSIAKKDIESSIKKAEKEISLMFETDLKKSDNKYFKELAAPKQAKIGQRSSTRDYSPITPATGETREGKPITPKRTFTQENAPEKMAVGDRIEHKRPKAKAGGSFYRDLYKDLDNPVRKGIMKKKDMKKKDMKKKDMKKARVDENMPWGEKRKERRYRNEAGTEQKGVHPQIAIGERGESKARPYKAPASVERELPGTNASYKKRSLDAHKKVIQEQKEMPKPNLPKSEKDQILKSLANEAWDNFKHKDLLIETIKKTEPELSEAEVIGIAKTYAYMDMKKKESEIEDMFEKNKDGRCWEGYEPVKGKKAYSKGSCQPIKKAKVDEELSGKKKKAARSVRNKDLEEKGVHKPVFNKPIPSMNYRVTDKDLKDSGRSEFGAVARAAASKTTNPKRKEEAKKIALERQKKVSEEQKKIPAPNLPKSEEMSKKEKPFHNYNPKKHSKEGGLNDKERERINREEGSNLKRPVTGKVKAGSKAAKRRKSFCARMSGNKGPTSKDGKPTPKGAALKRWKCNKNEE